jgi:lysozyme
MIDKLMADLKEDEGFIPYVYDDILGYKTLGYGFMVDIRKGGEIPRKVAEYWLHHEAFTSWQALCKALPWLVEQPEDVQRALGNMAYQMGVQGVLGFKMMLLALENGDRKLAATNAQESKCANQTLPRAHRVAKLIRG